MRGYRSLKMATMMPNLRVIANLFVPCGATVGHFVISQTTATAL